MTLKELDLKGRYDSDVDSLVLDFYIPVLSKSISYKRIAGYFSSNSLAISAKGIHEFIKNEGTIKLIANVIISEDDQEIIKEVIAQKEKEIISEIEQMDDMVQKSHLKMLAWLLKNERLEIKIAVVCNGLEHKKKGILEDKEGNIISFSGSNNETAGGWLYNHEDFHVFCSWIKEEKERHLIPDIEGFERLWNDETTKIKVYSISEAFRRDFIKSAPENDVEFQTLSNEMALMMSKQALDGSNAMILKESTSLCNIYGKLRDYQKEAIEKWEQNGYQGILKMATGTGKTFTAISAIARYLTNRKTGVVVIVAPKQLLVSQWSDELKSFGYTNIVEVMKTSSKWEMELKSSLMKIDLGREKEVFAVATYASFSSNKFKAMMETVESDILLICDEMHNSWAPEYKKGFIEKYNMKLGLSATPERYMDDEGTKEMLDYFGGVAFEFNLNDAIPLYLTEYEYYAELVHLTSDEKYNYDALSIDIAKMIAANDGKINEKILSKILSRAKIVTNSDSKWKAFEKILDGICDIEKTLVYCSPEQIEKVMEILRYRQIPAHKITYKESLDKRRNIIEKFKDKKYKVIVAMKVLDEGIDVPGIERAIFLANSGNPIEYVQRRGRILRKSPGKEYSFIHDILIFPWENIPSSISNSEKSMIKKELMRIEEFSKASRNPLEVLTKISQFYCLTDEW